MSNLSYRHRVLLISLACYPKVLESAYAAWRGKTQRSPEHLRTTEAFGYVVAMLEELGMILKRRDGKYAVTSYGAKVATSIANEPGPKKWSKEDVQFVSNIENSEANVWITSLRIASKKSSAMKGGTQPIPVIRATGLEEWSVPASSREPSTE